MRLVSVIVPAYNQCAFLTEAINSVLAQAHQDLEVIVVDDGSTDDTRAVTLGIADSRVRYVYQENRGLSAARNTGTCHARGEFVTFLDSDDQFVPQKLTILLEAFDRDRELGLAAGQAILVDESGQPVGEIFDRALPEDPSELLLGNPLHVGSVLMKREWLDRVGPFDERLRSYEDWDLWLRLALAGCRMAWVSRPVSLYRFHRAQMTRIGDQMTRATFAVLDKVFADPQLPQSWRDRRDEAYSRGFLRAAAQSYTARDFTNGQGFLKRAVQLVPDLAANGGARLAGVAAGWANHVKTPEPLAFLEGFYDHLPEELAPLGNRRQTELAKEALQLAFEAFAHGHFSEVRLRLRQAVGYRPQALLDRGVLSVLIQAYLPGSTERRRTVDVPGPPSWSPYQ